MAEIHDRLLGGRGIDRLPRAKLPLFHRGEKRLPRAGAHGPAAFRPCAKNASLLIHGEEIGKGGQGQSKAAEEAGKLLLARARYLHSADGAEEGVRAFRKRSPDAADSPHCPGSLDFRMENRRAMPLKARENDYGGGGENGEDDDEKSGPHKLTGKKILHSVIFRRAVPKGNADVFQ